MSSSRKIGMGFGARGLPDKDRFSKSDPYLVISKPSTAGGFHVLRTSEVKKNSLNPDWNNFFFLESELNGNDKDLHLRLEIFDDDGKKGPDSKDKLLCTGWFSLRQIEAAFISKSNMALSDGKSNKKAGSLVVRSYSEHVDNMPGTGQQGYNSGGHGQGYPPSASSRPQSGQQGYNSGGPGQAYPPSSRPQSGQPGYPPMGTGPGVHTSSRPQSGQQGYNSGGSGQGYPPSSIPQSGQPGYPPSSRPQSGQPEYPPSSRPQSGHPAYPPVGAGQRPPSGQPGYPPSGANQGYNHGSRGYPMGGNPAYPPAGQPPFNPSAMNMNDPVLFPPSSLPEGPGGWTNPNH